MSQVSLLQIRYMSIVVSCLEVTVQHLKNIGSAFITPYFVEYSGNWKQTFGFESAGLEGFFCNADHMCCSQNCQWISAADASFICTKTAVLCWEIKETPCLYHFYRRSLFSRKAWNDYWFLYTIEIIFFQYKPQLKLFHWIIFSVAVPKMWTLIQLEHQFRRWIM